MKSTRKNHLWERILIGRDEHSFSGDLDIAAAAAQDVTQRPLQKCVDADWSSRHYGKDGRIIQDSVASNAAPGILFQTRTGRGAS